MIRLIPKAASLLRNPSIKPIDPKDSAIIIKNAIAAGIPWLTKKFRVPEKPYPPNIPKSFCKPWGRITIPRAILAINAAMSPSV
jgi:hypothetical protein